MARKVDRSKSEGVGARLIAARESVGLTRQKAADRLGITYAALRELEVEAKLPSLERLCTIAEIWGVDASTLDPRLAGQSGPVPVLNAADLDQLTKVMIAGAIEGAGVGAKRAVEKWLAARSGHPKAENG